MATVLGILDEFCDRINQPRESTYFFNSAPAARQYVSLLKFLGGELLEYQDGWDQLKRIYGVVSSTGIANYQLPGDFLRAISGTAWDATNQIPLAGPLSNARLAFQTYGVNIATPYAGYQVNGAQGYVFNTSPYEQKSAGYFQISPAGQDSITSMVIAYISCNYFWPKSWVAGTAYDVGDKVSGINNIYICTDAITSSDTRPSVTSATEHDDDGIWEVYHEPYGPSADNDIAILDDELFVEGMRWAWYQSKQQFAAADIHEKRWRSNVRTALGRQNGATIVSAAYDMQGTCSWPIVSSGDWGPIPGG